MGSVNTQATRSTLTSVDTTLSENITATQDYIPVASTTNFSTSVVAEIESTNEVVSFTDISENLATYSEDFTNSAWTKRNVSATKNVGLAPNGTNTANLVAESANVNNHFWELNGVFPGNNIAGTFSVHFKKGTGANAPDWIQITSGGGQVIYANFNLTTGAVGNYNTPSAPTMVDVGNGWYRCSAPVNGAGSVTSLIFAFTNNVNTTQRYNPSTYLGQTDADVLVWGAQVEQNQPATTYLPTTSSALVGLTSVTRGVNGTTAQAASSGDSIQQLPYALSSVDMPVRLRAISVSPDGTGAARLTLCDNNGDTLCDVDIPDGKSYTLNLPEDGIIFPNGVFVSNTDNITAYTVYTEKYSGPYLTS